MTLDGTGNVDVTNDTVGWQQWCGGGQWHDYVLEWVIVSLYHVQLWGYVNLYVTVSVAAMGWLWVNLYGDIIQGCRCGCGSCV